MKLGNSVVCGIHPVLPMLAAVGLALLGACGGGSSNSIAPNPAPIQGQQAVTPTVDVESPDASMLPTLGSPDTLHSSSMTYGQWARGRDYEAGLPHQNINLDVFQDSLLFSPNWDGGQNREIAFALWAFNTSTFSPSGQLNFEWVEPVHDFSNVWIGLSNYSKQNWTWQNCPEPPDSMEYDIDTAISENGAFFVAVVILGTDNWELRGIDVRETTLPDITSVSPLVGGTNQNVKFSAMNEGGDADSWEWDFGGAATPGTSIEKSPLVTLGEPGIYECSVTGTNGLGGSSHNFSFEITRWNYNVVYHSWEGFDFALSNDGIPHITVDDGTYLNWDGDIWDYEKLAPSHFLEIELDGAGNPHFENLTKSPREFRYGYQVAGEWEYEIIDPMLNSGIYSSFALDPNGNPGCAYLSVVGGWELRYARRVGTSWESETVKEFLGDSSACTSLAIDSSGNPHIVLLNWFPGGNLEYIHWDNGEWLEHTLASGFWGRVSGSIVLDQDDNPHFAFPANYQDHFLKYAYWDQTEWTTEVFTETYVNQASIELDSQGKPWIVYHDSGDLNLVHHDGVNWQYEKVDTDYLGAAKIELDGLDSPHIAYYGVNADNLPEGKYELRYAYIGEDIEFPPYVLSVDQVPEHHNYTVQFKPSYVCKPDTYFWDFGGAATPNTSTEQSPTVTFGDAGNYNCSLLVEHEDGQDQFDFEVEIDHWTFETVVDSSWAGFKNSSMVLDNSGYPHICYLDRMNDDLHYAFWDGAVWNHEFVDEIGYDSANASLCLDTLGNPHIAYSNYNEYVFKYAWKSGGSWQYEALIDGYNSVSMALDAANNPHVSFRGNLDSESGLVYAYRGGLGWEYSLVDEATGQISMRLDSLGNPYIAFLDWPSLKYARWNGTGWFIEELDPQAAMVNPSLQIDSQDNAHVLFLADDYELTHLRWDGSQWQAEFVDYSSGIGGTLALDSMDRPHVVFMPGLNQAISYTYWDGAKWDKTLITEGLSSNTWSLALDEDDIPHISFPQDGALLHAYNPVP